MLLLVFSNHQLFETQNKKRFWRISFFYESLRGSTGIFFEKNEVTQNYLKHMTINSVFDADSKYDIGFNTSCSFLDENWLRNRGKWHPSSMLSEINRVAIFFRASHIYGFVALEKGYRMSYMRTLVIFNFRPKYSLESEREGCFSLKYM